MPTLTVRNVPDAVVRRLKARAAQNHRSLNGEVAALLELAVVSEPVDTGALLAEADSWFDSPLPDIANEAKRDGRRFDDDLGADGSVTR